MITKNDITTQFWDAPDKEAKSFKATLKIEEKGILPYSVGGPDVAERIIRSRELEDDLMTSIMERVYGDVRRLAASIASTLPFLEHSDMTVREAARDTITDKIDKLLKAGEPA